MKPAKIIAMVTSGAIYLSNLGCDNSMRGILEKTAQSKAEELEERIPKLIMMMESEGRTSLAYNGNSYHEPDKIMPENLTILPIDSQIISLYLSQMPEDIKKLCLDNVKYCIFSPNAQNNYEDVNGLSLGSGIIMIDTKADDGGIKNPDGFPSTIAHESKHESNRSNNPPILIDEKEAFEIKLRVLEHQLQSNDNPFLRAKYHNTRKRLTTANFLSNMGNAFLNVYPNEVILARDLLEADIPKETLQRYALLLDGERDMGYELYCAIQVARVVIENTREDALRILYGYVHNKNLKGQLLAVSSASAIQYLCPNSLKIHTTANESYSPQRTISLNFGNREKSSYIGTGHRVIDSFEVTDLPDIEELINDIDRSKKGYTLQTTSLQTSNNSEILENREIPSIQDALPNLPTYSGNWLYELYDGDKITYYTDDKGTTVVRFPNKEGKPNDTFNRFEIEYEDTNGNGKYDTLLIYYGSNSFRTGHPEWEIVMSKCDIYQNGRFIGAKLQPYLAKMLGRDMPFDIEEIQKQYNIESIKRDK